MLPTDKNEKAPAPWLAAGGLVEPRLWKARPDVAECTETRPEGEDEPTIGDLAAQVERMRRTVHYAALIVARSTMTPEERAAEDAIDSIEEALDAMEERLAKAEAEIASLRGGEA